MKRINDLDKKQKVAPLDNGATSVIATENRVFSWQSSDGSEKIKHLGQASKAEET